MAEPINLRTARKRAERERDARTAETNRLAHGQPKQLRKLEAARRAKAAGELERHRIEKGNKE